ncbi:hypothetical protein I4F81_006398 [Pyropia yezoensis]|uniref:Uncharacterized protein n=1 Tax=Pyropia yezoensis TaxID=2788 RepID=A0ACC3C1L4_PYRYE|nr:hypothetical protein I4F81_006398 [Neopyropia yezoensis]
MGRAPLWEKSAAAGTGKLGAGGQRLAGAAVADGGGSRRQALQPATGAAAGNGSHHRWRALFLEAGPPAGLRACGGPQRHIGRRMPLQPTGADAGQAPWLGAAAAARGQWWCWHRQQALPRPAGAQAGGRCCWQWAPP